MKSFRNNAHRTVFLEASKNMNRSNYALLAALYLLTADSRLWNQVKDCVQHNQILFDQMKPKNHSTSSYALFCVAKDLWLGRNSRSAGAQSKIRQKGKKYMINAIIYHGENTLILELPRSIYDIHEKLMSIGYAGGPKQAKLTDNEGDALRVKLYGRIEMGNHLIRMLSEENTLADANTLAFAVLNASDDIKLKLGEKIAKDQYGSIPEIVADIRQMTYDAGPIKRTFYCPLVGNIEVGYDDTFSVGSSFLHDYAWAIEDAIEKDRRLDDQDMAQYFHEDAGLKEKLASMVWGVEVYRGELFGKIECSLKEEMTPAEEEILKDYISGQNSDGWGEHFEQQPIDTEDGDLYVSFWNSGDDYAIMTQDELDAYIESQGMKMGGM